MDLLPVLPRWIHLEHTGMFQEIYWPLAQLRDVNSGIEQEHHTGTLKIQSPATALLTPQCKLRRVVLTLLENKVHESSLRILSKLNEVTCMKALA